MSTLKRGVANKVIKMSRDASKMTKSDRQAIGSSTMDHSKTGCVAHLVESFVCSQEYGARKATCG